MPIAELQNVSMTYGAVKALDDVSFQLKEGAAMAVLGPNGAGKTTAIRLLTGLKKPQKGKARLFGKNPRTPASRLGIGVTPQEASFPHAMKTGEILDFARQHYANPAPRDAIIEAFGLAQNINRMAIELSGGQQRKLAVALAFCGAPKVVFLDEPTTGIDAESRQRMWDYIKGFKAAGGAIFLTTHYLDEAEAIADQIVLINEGQVLREGSVDAVRSAVRVRVIRFRAETAPDLTDARRADSDGDQHTYLSSNADESVRALVGSGLNFRDLEVLPASLERAVAELLKTQNQGARS
jgi:ABC-2 type transport system ATP-binding protein